MKISDIEVIEFRYRTRRRPSKWGYGFGTWEDEEYETTSTITKISTDEGAEGYMTAGDGSTSRVWRSRFCSARTHSTGKSSGNWMYHMSAVVEALPERQMGVVDSALWDLLGRLVGLPVGKLLGGGGRDKVKAYASTFPNMGGPEDYAQHALECKEKGYTAFKIHAYIYWDPYKWEPAPLRPGYPKEDIEICKAVREAVGDDMVLMLDPFGVYTLEQSLWVGRELEKLNFYWLEHPMLETRIEPYRRLTRELDIAVMAPEQLPGGCSHAPSGCYRARRTCCESTTTPAASRRARRWSTSRRRLASSVRYIPPADAGPITGGHQRGRCASTTNAASPGPMSITTSPIPG